MKLMESFTRLQWHKRQNSFQSNSSPSLSKNKLFERIPIFPDVLEHIRKYNLSSRKRTTSITRAQPEEINSPKVVSIVLQLFSCRFQFRFSASAISSFPVETLPEVAILGKSNVGKSSLLNGITGTKEARISAKPGLTKTINWFHLGNSLALVDLPGYGFAFVEKEASENWKKLVQIYVTTRKSLKRVILLIDARHGIKDSDRETIRILESSVAKFQLVMTKSDLVDENSLARRLYLVQKEVQTFKNSIKRVLMLSSKTKAGIELLQQELFSLLPPENIKGLQSSKKTASIPSITDERMAQDSRSSTKAIMFSEKSHKKKALLKKKKEFIKKRGIFFTKLKS